MNSPESVGIFGKATLSAEVLGDLGTIGSDVEDDWVLLFLLFGIGILEDRCVLTRFVPAHA